MACAESNSATLLHLLTLLLLTISLPYKSLSIRIPDHVSTAIRNPPPDYPLKTAFFALGCFWRSEAVFGCLNGVVRTTVGYCGGSKLNPVYRSLGDHAESVQVSLKKRWKSAFDCIYFFVSQFLLKTMLY
jgi:peptide-methionine (S)-S-oxide reductase